MPSNYKILVSALALALCIAVFFLDDSTGIVRWVTLALGPLMAGAIWVLPEAKSKEIRKEVANRR